MVLFANLSVCLLVCLCQSVRLCVCLFVNLSSTRLLNTDARIQRFTLPPFLLCLWESFFHLIPSYLHDFSLSYISSSIPPPPFLLFPSLSFSFLLFPSLSFLFFSFLFFSSPVLSFSILITHFSHHSQGS